MNTCNTCGFFEVIPKHPQQAGVCYGEPPMNMPQMMPAGGAIVRPGAQAPLVPHMVMVERTTNATRPACRHWRAK